MIAPTTKEEAARLREAFVQGYRQAVYDHVRQVGFDLDRHATTEAHRTIPDPPAPRRLRTVTYGLCHYRWNPQLNDADCGTGNMPWQRSHNIPVAIVSQFVDMMARPWTDDSGQTYATETGK